MGLETFWFCLIAVVWGAYFLLEGFDFGVGMLLPAVGRDDQERGAMIETIGPFWDGNEVWLVIAGGVTFAAFPLWYATMFSGFYLALLLVLVLLIVRVVSFEWRDKGTGARWRGGWGWANTIASVGAPFVWGVALTDLLHGLPIDSNHDYAGNFGDLFSVYSLFGGVAVVLLFAFHGATFLTLRTNGELCTRAARAARALAIPAVAGGVALVVWTVVVAHDGNQRSVLPPALPAAATAVALIVAFAAVRLARSRLAFTMTALATLGVVGTIFTGLYPRAIVSSTSFSDSVTISNAASSHYALQVITIVAAVLVPVVLVYQAWTYRVFRARVGGGEPPRSPIDALAPKPDPPAAMDDRVRRRAH